MGKIDLSEILQSTDRIETARQGIVSGQNTTGDPVKDVVFVLLKQEDQLVEKHVRTMYQRVAEAQGEPFLVANATFKSESSMGMGIRTRDNYVLSIGGIVSGPPSITYETLGNGEISSKLIIPSEKYCLFFRPRDYSGLLRTSSTSTALSMQFSALERSNDDHKDGDEITTYGSSRPFAINALDFAFWQEGAYYPNEGLKVFTNPESISALIFKPYAEFLEDIKK